MITASLLADALRAAANVLDTPVAVFNAPGAVATPTPALAATPAATPAPAPVPSNISPDDITALILPHIPNAAIKEELGNAMRAMGINGLPDMQPHQYAAVYTAFQAVLQRHGVGGAAPAPAPTSASII
jgi:hypothetical protein